MLAGCNSGLQPSVPTGSAIAREIGGGQLRYNSLRRASVGDVLIHSFGAAGDGYSPQAALLDVNGTFYGTTAEGPDPSGCGTVFKITPSGHETVLHSFDGTDGCHPGFGASLINVNGMFYGTTCDGGALDDGTVFKVTPSGNLTVVYKFGAGNDGYCPNGALTNVNGVLYGTTFGGGAHADGTVFSVTTMGQETVRYSFKGRPDGNGPYADLINFNGTLLYGTTSGGGTGCPSLGVGCGTVFSVTTSGSERVLHSFSGPPDGNDPEAGLTSVNGTIYGTTAGGGLNRASCDGGGGCGIVFSMDAKGGNEKVLYSFVGPPHDGWYPEASLLNLNGTLYGTTDRGGTSNYGTVFTITTSGHESVLHSFMGSGNGHHPDGEHPESGLIYLKDNLFGTTANGGAYTGCPGSSGGCGTVFAVTP